MAEILPLEEKDIPLVTEIIAREFSYIEVTEPRLLWRMQQPNIFVFKLVEKKETIGFIDLEIFYKSNCTGRITGMAVLEKYRGKGFGKKLAAFGKKFLQEKGCKKIVLLVRKGNKTAKKIYEEIGFKKTGRFQGETLGEEIEEMELAGH